MVGHGFAACDHASPLTQSSASTGLMLLLGAASHSAGYCEEGEDRKLKGVATKNWVVVEWIGKFHDQNICEDQAVSAKACTQLTTHPTSHACSPLSHEATVMPSSATILVWKR